MITRSYIAEQVKLILSYPEFGEFSDFDSLDSLAMVQLITDVEEGIENGFGIQVNLKYDKYTKEEFIDHIWYSLPRKLIVTDLDFTMWHGIAGEEGQKVKPNVGYQKWLIEQADKGVILAISSSNTEFNALDVLDNHPDQILRKTDFSALCINWTRKDNHIHELLSDFNLLPSAVVFIDDDIHNREVVSHVFPEVLCIHPDDYVKLRCFDHETTKEDFMRAEFYDEEKQRKALMAQDDWLGQLNLTVDIRPYNRAEHETRVVQLLNKVNQMNLSNRRMNKDRLFAWLYHPLNKGWVVSAKDKFGDYGIIGYMSATFFSKIIIQDFVVSCRALGRGIEEAMLYYVHTCSSGEISCNLVKTDNNEPAQMLFQGIAQSKWPDLPDHITLASYE